MLKSRLRCKHSYFDGTANPDSPSHYIKQFIDTAPDIFYQTSTIFDNPYLPKEFVENLCQEYAGTVYYKRYIQGEWSLAEGLIYPMYEQSFEEPPENWKHRAEKEGIILRSYKSLRLILLKKKSPLLSSNGCRKKILCGKLQKLTSRQQMKFSQQMSVRRKVS